MVLFLSLLISLALMAVVIVVHYTALNFISTYTVRLRVPKRLWVMVVVFCIYLAHLVEISLFALAYFLLHSFTDLGRFSATFEPTAINYLFFSATSYSTLGLTEFHPLGGFKLMSSLEALTGFTLITWSASFSYTAVRGFWDEAEKSHGKG